MHGLTPFARAEHLMPKAILQLNMDIHDACMLPA